MSDADNIECIVWDKDRIKTIKKTNYEFCVKLNNVLTEDLTSKITA